MPGDISSSSEDEIIESESPPKRNKHVAKYQCPPEFVSFTHKPCSSTLTDRLSDSNTELWLIKAPSNFSPDCFSSLKMPLLGLQTVQTASPDGGGGGRIYSVLGGPSGTSELRLLTGGADAAAVTRAPAFSGLLNVCESYGDVSANQAPQPVPAAPAPCVPPGLRQRFQPFGSKTPTVTAPRPPPSPPAPSGAASTSLTAPLVVKREREEKKKRKKRESATATLGGEEEAGERVVRVKVEPVAATPGQAGAPEAPEETEPAEERRKKKKRKRDKERGEGGERHADDLADLYGSVEEKEEEVEVEVKPEPVDYSYGDMEDSGKKKKKKKKKSKHEHD